MRLTTGISSGKAAYYDRNPLTKMVPGNGAASGPHVTSVRISYTVPAARKFQLALWTALQNRTTVATTAGQVNINLHVTPNGGGGGSVAVTYWNAVNVVDSNRQASGSNQILVAGDVISIDDNDSSTGGTVDYFEMISGTEFDA